MNKLNREGFTMTEMLFIIFLIVFLVVITVPTIAASAKKGKANADAADLRIISEEVSKAIPAANTNAAQEENIVLACKSRQSFEADISKSEIIAAHAQCRSFSDAQVQVFFSKPSIDCDCYTDGSESVAGSMLPPSFIGAYLVDGSNYYDVEYLDDVAANGTSFRDTSMPEILKDAEMVICSGK